MNELRFSIRNVMDAVRIELAGNLEGVEVEMVYQAWQRDAWDDPLKRVIIDITLITEVDEHGRALLVIMHHSALRSSPNSHESSAIAQTLITEPVEPAASKPGWFAS
jgi:hypothetical protein